LKIHLEKQIPIQAGLGGGSSNAATTLWALNEFSGRLASLEQLIEMGSLLGSDVPFFFSLGTAYCTGRGEIFEPFELSTPLKGYVAKPPFGLSTSLIYKETEIEQLPQRDPRKDLTAYPIFYNDLEWAAFRVEKRLFAFRKELKAIGFNTVAMTGSGSAFFCMGEPFFDQDKSFPLIPFASVSRHADGWYGVSSI
jgi:4-diphosphocytidyl-2-C-methyl-D-erythritol kinase